MATLNANFGFSTDAIYLYQLYLGTYDIDYWNNYYFSRYGYTYEDSLDLYWDQSGTQGVTEFYGHGLLYDDFYSSVYAGTITAVFEHIWDGATHHEWWGVQGISISAVAVQDAMNTVSTADDYAIWIAAFSGSDTFYLSNYADTAHGYGGNDALNGYAGADRLYGDNGGDRIKGGGGNDVLDGGSGNDVLTGGAGRDTLKGGSGSDDFVFVATSESGSSSTTRDVIIGGFSKGYDDIVFSDIDANTGRSGNQAFLLDTNGSFSAGEIRQKIVSSGLLIEFNTDSDATVEMALLIQDRTSKLAATDFLL